MCYIPTCILFLSQWYNVLYERHKWVMATVAMPINCTYLLQAMCFLLMCTTGLVYR